MTAKLTLDRVQQRPNNTGNAEGTARGTVPCHHFQELMINHIRSVLNCFRSVLENDDSSLSSFSRTDLKQFRTERM